MSLTQTRHRRPKAHFGTPRRVGEGPHTQTRVSDVPWPFSAIRTLQLNGSRMYGRQPAFLQSGGLGAS